MGVSHSAEVDMNSLQKSSPGCWGQVEEREETIMIPAKVIDMNEYGQIGKLRWKKINRKLK